ncbi:MAG TPA: SMP-30/gluconolactonase/LRE family protein [Phycisphaerae bacterium]|nr:SMP-30/gluconolactonase/LRE family protein [Phycisphaerae bacterium]
MAYHIEQVANTNDKCGEAPTWDAANNRVLWVDNESSFVHALSLDTGQVTRISTGLMVSGVALNTKGGYVFAGATGLHVWRGQDDYRTVISEFAGESLYFNDILADPSGRVYAGTLYWGGNGMEKFGKLYLVKPDGSAEIVDEGIELSNGLGFSPDNRTLYYTDSFARRIYAYDVDTASGRLSNRRVFVQVPSDEGLPDGLTVDAEGFVWSAQWYGGQVVRYDPQGKVERRIAMPMMQVSSCLFGGPNLTDLYVTTAANSWEGPYAPPGYNFKAANIGGPLYRVRLDIQGKPDYAADL